MAIRHLQLLIQGEKTRLHIAGRSHRSVPLRLGALPAFATADAPVRVLAASDRTAHTSVPRCLHSRLLHWLARLLRSSAPAGASSAHRPPARSPRASLSDEPLSTGQRRQRPPLLAPSSSLVTFPASSWLLFLALGGRLLSSY